MIDVWVFQPLRQLAGQLRAGTVSPVELAETFLHRLETLGPRYNAVVTVTRERAMAQARTAEREIAAGRYRGPLHGIPYGAKDLLATSGGIPTTWGAAPFSEQRFDEDATVIRKLEEAGAVLCAKLAMVELAGGMGYRQPNASFTGPGINPWNVNAWSGGSSSGSGSAVVGGARAVRHRLGDVGLDPRPGGLLRHRRPPADLRPRQPPRGHGALLDARQARPARPHGGRLRPRARRHRGPRRGRPDHDGPAVPLRGRWTSSGGASASACSGT